MSDYIPYIPKAFPGQAQPDPAIQMVLQATYGQIMHAIKDALDSYVHDGAEQTIVEFKYDDHYPDQPPGSIHAVDDYLREISDSPWAEDTAAEIAPNGAPRADIEMALRSILRASYARLDWALRVAKADAMTGVSA